MAGGLTRKQTKALRMVAALVALAACLFQALVAFGSLKAQAWSTNDTSQGLIVLLVLVFILFAMLVASAALLVSPETAAVFGAIAVGLGTVVVGIILVDAGEPVDVRFLTDAGILLAAPVTVLALGTVLTRLEGGSVFRR